MSAAASDTVSEPPLQNPNLFVIDADALLQILIAEGMRLLLFIKRTYRMQAATTEAVEMEVRRNPVFRARLSRQFEKALNDQVLVLLDTRTLPAFVTTDPNAVYNSLQVLGSKYERAGMDYGEAYTYAAGLVLNVPVISNDLNAVKTARQKNLKLPQLVGRVFDIVALCYQAGHVSAGECDQVRKALSEAGEFLPAAFNRRSFADGLPHFYCRIHDVGYPTVGAPTPIGDLDIRLSIRRVG